MVTKQADSAYQLNVLLLCPWPLTHLLSHSHHVTTTLTLLASTLDRLGTSLGVLPPLCACGLQFQVQILDELQPATCAAVHIVAGTASSTCYLGIYPAFGSPPVH